MNDEERGSKYGETLKYQWYKKKKRVGTRTSKDVV